MTNVESNVHVKVAMADVLGLFVITMFTMAVAIFCLGSTGTFAMVGAIGFFVGVGTLLAAVFAYMNENLLGTAIFGPLAIFFFTIPLLATSAISSAVLCMVIGIIILIDAIIALAQPVKILSILLFIAAIAFFVTALFYNNGNDYKQAAGILWLIYSVLSWYMAAGIMLLVMKGKSFLPLLIKA